MVCAALGLGKNVEPRFAAPPLTEESPTWKKIDDELPRTHVARQIVKAMEILNLQSLFASYSPGGSDALRPDLMLRIVLIEIRLGRLRPSQWFKDTLENTALQWAGFGIRPSRSAWYSFRDRVGPFLDEWFRDVLQQAIKKEITPARRGSLDGSFVAANASRHRLLNEKRLDQRRQELASMCERDSRGETPQVVPAWMAKTAGTRLEQAERYERAKMRLNEFQAANQRQCPSSRRPREKIVVSATDPESALGPDKEKVFRPLYNVQLITDLDSPLTLGYEVFAQNSDGGTFRPMLQCERERIGLALSALVCDAAYITGCNLAICEQQRVTLYGPWQENDFRSKRSRKEGKRVLPKDQFTWISVENQYRCPEGHLLRWIGKERRIQANGEINTMHRYRCSPEHCKVCGLRESCTKNPARGRAVKRSEHEDLIEAHRARMETPEAKSTYRLRKQTVELGYADMKKNRALRTFSGRGLTRARIEVSLIELARNLITVVRDIKKCTATEGAHENLGGDTR